MSKERLIDLLNGILKDNFEHVPLSKVLDISERLIANGVLAPPVKAGDTVYAAIDDVPPHKDYIVSFKVCGVGIFEDKWQVFDHEGENYEVGSELCLLSEEDAKRKLEEWRKEKES